MTQAARNQNIFAYLDSDDEDTPKVVKKQEPAPSSAPVTLNKPAAGNKKSGKKAAPVVVEGAEKKDRAPRSAPASGRGGRGGRGGDRGEGRGERRQFERRSGTGRGKETSKQGGGARNWGNDSDKTELAAEAEVQDGAKADDEAGATEETAAAVEEEAEEEEVQLTLDEYLAQKKSARSGEHFADVEVRQVETDFSGAVQLTKDGKTPDFVESAFEKVYTKKTSGRKKTFITDVGFQAARPERTPRFEDRGERSEGGRGGRGGRGERSEGGRGGRGGREGGRGGREGGRGGREGGRGGRGPRSSAAAPNVTDLSAFPSLG